jgi:hypothetical protein
MAPAESRNVTASIAIVAPGPMAAARNPASAGPTIQPTQREPAEVRAEHHLAAVPAIRIRAGRQPDDEIRQGRQHAHDPHRQAGSGEG